MESVKGLRIHVSMKAAISIVVAAALIVTGLISPEIAGLTHEGKTVLFILLAGVVLWITEAVPLVATSFIMLVMMPLTGVCSFNDAYANTAGSIVFFLMATFTFTVVLDATTVPTRIAGAVLRWSGTSSRKMMLGLMVAIAVVSMVMSDVAACGTFISVAKRLLELNGAEKGKSGLGKALMIGIPWASYAGGCMVMTGNGCNVITVGLFSELFGVNVTFVEWMMMGVPFGIILLLLAWEVLCRVYKPEAIRQEAIDETIAEVEKLDPLSLPEKKTVAIILLAIVCWVLSSWIPVLNTAMVGLLAIVLLSIPGSSTISFKTIISRMNWDVILMIMCILSLAHFIVATGAGDWIVSVVIGAVPSALQTPTVIILVLATIGCVLHNIMPVGTAVAGVLAYPFGIIAMQFDISMAAMVIIVAVQASISYILPIDLVPVQTYMTGYYKMVDTAKVGWVMSLVLIILMATMLPVLCGVFGLA